MAGLTEVAKHAGVTVAAAKSLLASIVTLLGMEGAKHITLQGFGSFSVKHVPGRTVSSPAILGGREMVIRPQVTIKFKPSAHSKRRLNLAFDKRKKGAAKLEKIAKDPPKKALRPAAPAPAGKSKGK